MAGGLALGGHAADRHGQTFVVAEIGINHDGSLKQALNLIDAAADSGADAVKVQWFKASSMYHKRAGTYTTASGSAVDIYELMRSLALPTYWVPQLTRKAAQKGLLLFPTICDLASLREAERFDFPMYKVASYEISHIPLLEVLGRTGKPVILSTGAAKLADVEEALDALEGNGCPEIGLLHCVASYPTSPEQVNLRTITTLRSAFPETLVGFSDHTADPTSAPVQAVLIGARIIEKHLTLDRTLPGADHCFALEPDGFSQMVKAIRAAEQEVRSGGSGVHDPVLLGTSRKRILKTEAFLRSFAYRTIVAVRDIQPGEPLTERSVAILRSGGGTPGLHPRYFSMLVSGHYKTTRRVEIGRCLQWEDVLTR